MSLSVTSDLNDDEIELEYVHEGVRGVVPGSTGTQHVCHIKFDGRRMCDCVGHYYHDTCSHLVALAEAVPVEGAREQLLSALERDAGDPHLTMQKNKLTIPTTLDPFNKMMSPNGDENHPLAGMPRKSGIGLSGRPESGKTTLSYQLAHEVMMKGGEGTNVLMFDTEGSAHTYYGWQETFQTRFGLDTEMVYVDPVIDSSGEFKRFDMERKPDADHQIFLMDVRDLTKILTLHGRPARIGTEDGKMKMEPNGDFPNSIRDTPIGQFVIQNEVDYMAYDSITNPLETFTNRQQDRPTRAKATAWWMLQAQALAEERDMVQVYITHLSKNPTNPYDRPDVLGGKNIKHQIKFSIYLRSASDNERAMKLFRHPSKEAWDGEWIMDLQDGKGFVDIE